ncbi:5' nucleotidase, NT5C type [Terrisporobacter sp.]
MNNLNICVDIDGTITSPYHFISYLNEMYNKDVKAEDCTTVYWYNLFDEDGKTMIEKFHEKYMHSYEEAEIIENAKEIIEELNKDNNIYFVTARGEELVDITLKWLNKNGLSHIDTYMLGSTYKIDKAKELKCDIFIEDNPLNAMQLAKEGIKVFLIETNYNKEIQHDNITRVKNWKHIKEIIDNM